MVDQEDKSGAFLKTYQSPICDNQLLFRAMHFSDLTEVMLIEKHSFSSPWSLGFFKDELAASYARSLLALIDQKIVGYVIYWKLPKELDIHNIAVHPNWRRLGVARSLLSLIVEEAKRDKFNRVTLEVRISNIPAQNLYQSLGFVAQGVRKGYYSNDGEDAVVMVLDLFH